MPFRVSAIFLLVLGVACAGDASPSGAVVAEFPLDRYEDLWLDSPFTSDPPEVAEAEPNNPLDHYALGGISRLADGYYAILLDRRDSARRVVVRPDSDSEPEILDVNWSDDWAETTVLVGQDGHRAMLAFDRTLLSARGQPSAGGRPASAEQTPRPVPSDSTR